MYYSVPALVLQSSWRGRWSWLLYLVVLLMSKLCSVAPIANSQITCDSIRGCPCPSPPPLDPPMKTHSSDVLFMVWLCACHVLWTLLSNYFLSHFLWTCDMISGWYKICISDCKLWSPVRGVCNCWGVYPDCYNDAIYILNDVMNWQPLEVVLVSLPNVLSN